MLPKEDLDKAVHLAKKYNIGKLYLVGSSLYNDPDDVNDYDFAISDYPIEVFFEFYSELYRSMPKEVDLIDLSNILESFRKILLREGKLIYEKRAA